MTELLNSAQMRAIEMAEIDSGAVTGLQLMERAGHGAVAALFVHWPELATRPHRAMILCGPGNNGGDGFVMARLLQGKGWQVDVFQFGDPAKLPPDAKTNHDLWTDLGQVQPLSAKAVTAQERPDLIIDAVFGTGLTRPLPEDLSRALDVHLMEAWPGPQTVRRMALDCPSGLNLDTGEVPVGDSAGERPSYRTAADLTVSFHSLKLGHKIGSGASLCGAVTVVDIGLRGPDAQERSALGHPPDPERVRLVSRDEGQADPWPGNCIAKFSETGHKYAYGHVLVLSGGVGRGGAARMAARSALRSGAGLVTLVCPPAALQENACHLDAVMLRPCADAEAFVEIVDDRVTGLCLGPGLGVDARTRDLVRAALRHERGNRATRMPAVVLDADALTSFEDDPELLFKMCHTRTLLTPHEGEFARLFPDLAQSRRGLMSKVGAVRQAADRAGCVILLKGEDTVIAEPGGGCSVHSATGDLATPWLATAGAGDVLAGLIAGLAAPDAAPDLFCVAEAAVWLHCEAARQYGPGLIAEDLPDELPKLFSTLAG